MLKIKHSQVKVKSKQGWEELPACTSEESVLSVNGRTGHVVLTDEEIYDNSFKEEYGENTAEVVSQKFFTEELDKKINDEEISKNSSFSSQKTTEIFSKEISSEGSVVTIEPITNSPLKCVTTFEPIQEGSGDPSPSNVRPIRGVEGLTLARCGKNILHLGVADFNKEVKGVKVHFDYANQTLRFSGNRTNNQAFVVARFWNSYGELNGLFIKDNINYVLSYSGENADALYMQLTYINNEGKIKPFAWTDSGQVVFRKPSDFSELKEVQVGVRTAVQGNTQVNSTITCMIKFGSEIIPYEPYHGNDFTTNFGQTVYGGTYDWESGKLQITHACLSLKIADMNNSEAFPGWQGLNLSKFSCAENGPNHNLLCNSVREFYTNKRGGVIFLNKATYGLTQSQWKSQYPDLTCQFEFEYSNGNMPNPIKLTPAQITALSGTNTLYTDHGETIVKHTISNLSYQKNLLDRIAILEKKEVAK